MTPPDDFWPDDFGTDPIRLPATILKEQAALLGPKTKNLVEAEVKTNPGAKSGELIHRFILKAPTLNYSYALFTVVSGIRPYPAKIHVNEIDIAYMPENEEKFIAAIREILSSKNTSYIIKSLIAQAQT